MEQGHRVVILGGGFGGLVAAQKLKRAPVEVTLIDRRNFHLFQPLLYQVATGSLSPGEIAAPLRGVLSRQKNTRVLLGDVLDIDPVSKQVVLADGATFDYDSLIVAAGSQTSYYGHDVWSRWAPGLKSIEEATTLRHKTLYASEVAERLSTKTVIWAGGVTVAPLARTLAKRTGAETDRGGRIKVGPDLTIANFPDIYVVGDLALSLDASGKPLTGVAQVAMQKGAYAAKAIVRKTSGQPKQKPFAYFDKGNLAVIGRAAAVANIFGVHVSGLTAWLVWALIHLTYIVQFQSRILVFIQWAIQDLTFSRGARLITGMAPTDFNFNREMAGGDRAVEPKVEPGSGTKTDSVAVPAR